MNYNTPIHIEHMLKKLCKIYLSKKLSKEQTIHIKELIISTDMKQNRAINKIEGHFNSTIFGETQDGWNAWNIN